MLIHINVCVRQTWHKMKENQICVLLLCACACMYVCNVNNPNGMYVLRMNLCASCGWLHFREMYFWRWGLPIKCVLFVCVWRIDMATGITDSESEWADGEWRNFLISNFLYGTFSNVLSLTLSHMVHGTWYYIDTILDMVYRYGI